MAKIKCGHCSTYSNGIYHNSRFEVRACAERHYNPTSQRIANVRAQVATPRPNEWSLSTPRAMVEAIRDGRYAVSLTGGTEKDHFTFMRITRHKTGKRAGQMIVQTQHSETYKPYITFYPGGTFWMNQNKQSLDHALLMVAADPFTSAMNYARILNVCSRCGKTLTDERSRYYGIGPECEKHWPEIINYVNETKGLF